MSSLWPRVRPLVLFGWLVALIRFGIDASVKPERSNPIFYVGVDVLMPIAYLVVGVKAIWDDIPWKKYPLIALMIGLLVWFLPNAIAYTTGRFLGWTARPLPRADRRDDGREARTRNRDGPRHGGRRHARIAPAHDTLLIWLPGNVRRKKRASAA